MVGEGVVGKNHDPKSAKAAILNLLEDHDSKRTGPNNYNAEETNMTVSSVRPGTKNRTKIDPTSYNLAVTTPGPGVVTIIIQ